ncbi:response regulator transcription factor [Oceanirhabdus sp. W0125-5]|uniref:response regulator transcription factor n=1 Tax=Oceanirhabdus sp. W0125-5 TaxID=2999116 RepID=UPI0022F31721|nr:helix-turn-helix transcriptional regulator [Oceanirhabdus sp. W0125-5]WBW96362.1 helix-turn-helix transcriptional regulator [Oceanirhabdus sp. W0125-5]
MIIDNFITYISEFSKSFESLYETSHMLYIVIYLIFFGIILISRFIISDLYDDKLTINEKRFTIMIPIILLVLFIFAPFQLSEFLIYFSFFAALSYLTIRTYKNMKNSTHKFDETILNKYKILMFVIIILSVVGIVDNAIYYISYNKNSYITLTTSEYRTVGLDIIKLLICVIGLKYLYSSFESIFDNKELGKKSETKKLEDFCIEYSLTNRQREIIELIIEGCSNKEIGSKLHITEGTVKTHIYNIFKKTDISSRNQLLKKIMYD